MPVCSVELLGYSADIKTAEQILKGTFATPTDTDPVNVIILNEVDITDSTEDFQYYLRRVKEHIFPS